MKTISGTRKYKKKNSTSFFDQFEFTRVINIKLANTSTIIPTTPMKPIITAKVFSICFSLSLSCLNARFAV